MTPHYVEGFMQAALAEAELALTEGEVPVGCVLVHIDDNEAVHAATRCTPSVAEAKEVVAPSQPSLSSLPLTSSEEALTDVKVFIAARGRNRTNAQRHALAHAEFVAVQHLIEGHEAARGSTSTTGVAAAGKEREIPLEHGGDGGDAAMPITVASATFPSTSCQDLSTFVLYVTVEPCVMCGAMLLYNTIGHVFFGCRNPRFGGNGTVLPLHDVAATPSPSTHWNDRDTCPAGPVRVLEGATGVGGGDGEAPKAEEEAAEEPIQESLLPWGWEGWPGYASDGGHSEAEAIALLQRFYERENLNAPGHKRRRKP